MVLLMDKKKIKVVVAMSGGVDSSVAAALLVEQGYDVTGMMLRLWSEPGRESFNRCCTPSSMAMAKKIAGQLDIPFYAIDAKEKFHQEVITYFIDEYQKGVTPNPCFICNRHIRFEYLLNRALGMGADYLATGHYAQVAHSPNKPSTLRKGIDTTKDQSYILSALNQNQLQHSLFPIGGYTKKNVREVAEKYNLPSAKEKDSQDLCFLAGTDYISFLSRNSLEINIPGKFIDINGNEIGTHNGLPHYTIGQRKRLGLTSENPLYVIEKDIKNNSILVGTKDMLGKSSVVVGNLNWIDSTFENKSFSATVKIRYKSPLAKATINHTNNNKVEINFDEKIPDVTPGQIATIYQDEYVIASGIIEDDYAIATSLKSINLLKEA
jgi:tRNA-uridine 2-sulfurtransferase